VDADHRDLILGQRCSGRARRKRWARSSPPYTNAPGNPRRGAQFFQTICAVCHGFDGKAINFHSADDPEYVGTVAADNPWEALHKIRFGQPGVGMIALTALSMGTLVDILSYAQTLPTK